MHHTGDTQLSHITRWFLSPATSLSGRPRFNFLSLVAEASHYVSHHLRKASPQKPEEKERKNALTEISCGSRSCIFGTVVAKALSLTHVKNREPKKKIKISGFSCNTLKAERLRCGSILFGHFCEDRWRKRSSNTDATCSQAAGEGIKI